MTQRFVAVLLNPNPAPADADRAALLAAGAIAVFSWDELPSSPEQHDDVPAVLLDLAEHSADQQGAGLVTGLAASLSALDAVDSAAGRSGAVIASTRPVTDTLKQVDVDGVLTGTADRNEHRFVATPIAARLQLLRAVSSERGVGSAGRSPSAAAVLAALVARGATVVGTP
jgi:hypothetical protein